jgi:hypothetical protein
LPERIDLVAQGSYNAQTRNDNSAVCKVGWHKKRGSSNGSCRNCPDASSLETISGCLRCI